MADVHGLFDLWFLLPLLICGGTTLVSSEQCPICFILEKTKTENTKKKTQKNKEENKTQTRDC